jgi:hypothetical protein
MTDLINRLENADGADREWHPIKGLAAKMPRGDQAIDVCLDIRDVEVMDAKDFVVLSDLYIAYTQRHLPNALLRKHGSYNEILGWSCDRVIGWRPALLKAKD